MSRQPTAVFVLFALKRQKLLAKKTMHINLLCACLHSWVVGTCTEWPKKVHH